MSSPRSEPLEPLATSQPRPLPLLHTPYKLPRTSGAALIAAPSMPFADPAPVLAAVAELGDAARADYEPDTGLVSIACAASSLSRLSQLLPATGRPGLSVRVDVDAWPIEETAADHVRALAEAGVEVLAVHAPPGRSDGEIVAWFELGKAALTHALPLHWTGRLPADARAHGRHLTPARDDTEWRAAWRYAALIWRRGPGYAFVEDARDPEARRQLVLTLAPLAAAFGPDLNHSARSADLAPGLTAELVDLGLAVTIADLLVWLPYRMRRWPVTPDR